MKPFAALFGIALFGACSQVRAEMVYWDDVVRAVHKTGVSLAAGEDRQQVLERIKPLIARKPPSTEFGILQDLGRDLADSVEKVAERERQRATPTDAPERFLSETTIRPYVLAYSDNWHAPLRQFTNENPADPVTLILQQDRNSIEQLLPLLRDRSPTRGYFPPGPVNEAPRVPRVCDVALNLIEYFSLCRFHFNASTATRFHELPAEVREERIRRIEQWWRENKERSIAEGIRAQLPHGDFYAKVWMAKSLVRVGKEQGSADEEYGMQVLRDLVRENHGHFAARAAKALAEFGDYSPVDVLYSKPVRDSSVVWYLTDYGTRREWELLYQLSERDVKLRFADGNVLGSVINARKSSSSPYAIPFLGLALSQTDRVVRRDSLNKPEDRYYFYADRLVEPLQNLTGADFGYHANGTAEQRDRAIRRAQKWWADVGKVKYTFDYIQEHLLTRPSEP